MKFQEFDCIVESQINRLKTLTYRGFQPLVVESLREIKTGLDKERNKNKILEQKLLKVEEDNKQLNERLYKLEQLMDRFANKASL